MRENTAQSKKSWFKSSFLESMSSTHFGLLQYLVKFQLALIVVQNHICHGGFDNARMLKGFWEFLRGMLTPGSCWGKMWCTLGVFCSSVTVQMPWTLVGILPWESEQSVCGQWGKPRHKEKIHSSGDSEEQNVPFPACKWHSKHFPEFFLQHNSSRPCEIGTLHLLH